MFASKMMSLLIMVEILYEDGTTEPQICMEVCSQISMLVI